MFLVWLQSLKLSVEDTEQRIHFCWHVNERSACHNARMQSRPTAEDAPCTSASSPQWTSLAEPESACWPGKGCAACSGPGPGCTPAETTKLLPQAARQCRLHSFKQQGRATMSPSTMVSTLVCLQQEPGFEEPIGGRDSLTHRITAIRSWHGCLWAWGEGKRVVYTLIQVLRCLTSPAAHRAGMKLAADRSLPAGVQHWARVWCLEETTYNGTDWSVQARWRMGQIEMRLQCLY